MTIPSPCIYILLLISLHTLPTHPLITQLQRRRCAPFSISNRNVINNNLHYNKKQQQQQFPLHASNVIDDTNQRTLYEILQAPPTATRDELKQRFVTLSKTLHPDARFNLNHQQNDTDTVTIPSTYSSDDPTFSEVVTAWRVLSNPTTRKEYDRTLFAAYITKDIERAASDVTSAAAPVVNSFFEKVALPALRRTTAAAAAAVSAASDDLNKKYKENDGGSKHPGVDFTEVVGAAFKAGANAGKVIDRMELEEKGEALYARSKEEMRRARELQRTLVGVVTDRIRLSLQMPKAVITSDEAKFYLERVLGNVTTQGMEESLMTEREQEVLAMRRKVVGMEISALEETERGYEGLLQDDEKVNLEYQAMKNDVATAEKNVEAAIQSLEDAKAAIKRARLSLTQKKQAATALTTALYHYEPTYKRSAQTVSKKLDELTHHRETVRRALVNGNDNPEPKLKSLIGSIFHRSSHETAHDKEEEEEETERRLMGEILEMMEREKELTTECGKARDRAVNLKATSKKLKARSEVLRQGMINGGGSGVTN